jgi:hypothetical protein
MISDSQAAEIRRLLDEGRLSQRQIARAVRVSRGTVDAMASGRRPDRLETKPEPLDDLEPLGPPQRCPDCGGLVYLPCVLCRLRAVFALRSPRAVPRGGDEPHAPVRIGLNLKPHHRERYERVRRRRMEMESCNDPTNTD